MVFASFHWIKGSKIGGGNLNSIVALRRLLPVKNQDVVWRDNEVFFLRVNLDTIEAVLAIHNVEGATRPTVRTEKFVTLFNIFHINLSAIVAK